MKGHIGLGPGLRAAAAVVLALGVGLLTFAQVSAQDEAVSIGRATVAPDAQGTVDLEALDIGTPGLGAWEIGIIYDPSVVTPVSCNAQAGSVCNLNFASDQIRVTGATASGHLGDTTLASITFACGSSEGSSALTLTVPVLADATTGSPQPISADIENGDVTCTESAGAQPTPRRTTTPDEEEPTPTATPPVITGLPSTGTGGSGGGSALGWVIAALAGTGVMVTAGMAALRLHGRRA